MQQIARSEVINGKRLWLLHFRSRFTCLHLQCFPILNLARHSYILSLLLWAQALTIDLPVQLGSCSKVQALLENAQNLCRRNLGSSPPPTLKILCENCAVQICAISAHFVMPLGTSRDYPARKFCIIFSDTWHVLKSASIQANNVSTQAPCFQKNRLEDNSLL